MEDSYVSPNQVSCGRYNIGAGDNSYVDRGDVQSSKQERFILHGTTFDIEISAEHMLVDENSTVLKSIQSRWLKCDCCGEYLWKIDQHTDLRQFFPLTSCSVCDYRCHADCKPLAPANCRIHTQVYLWSHVDSDKIRPPPTTVLKSPSVLIKNEPPASPSAETSTTPTANMDTWASVALSFRSQRSPASSPQRSHSNYYKARTTLFQRMVMSTPEEALEDQETSNGFDAGTSAKYFRTVSREHSRYNRTFHMINCWFTHQEGVFIGTNDLGQAYEITTSNVASLGPVICPMNRYVKEVCFGAGHTLILEFGGLLYSLGNNFEGQLGLGNHVTTVNVPTLLTTLSDQNVCIAKIACGGNHSVVLSTNNELFVWGDGRNGRLGLGNEKSQFTPTPLQITLPDKLYALYPNNEMIISHVVCGWSHTLIALDIAVDQELSKSYLFTFGRGQYGQCGHGPELNDEMLPRLLECPEIYGKKILSVGGGYYHSAMVTEDHKVYCFGFGGEGQCGQDTRENQNVPKEISSLEGVEVTKVCCGGLHTFAITEDNDCYVWGGFGKHRYFSPVKIDELKQRKGTIVFVTSTMHQSIIVLAPNSEIAKIHLPDPWDIRRSEKIYPINDAKFQRTHLLTRLVYTGRLMKHYESMNNKIIQTVENNLLTLQEVYRRQHRYNLVKVRTDKLRDNLANLERSVIEERQQLEEQRELALKKLQKIKEKQQKLKAAKEELTKSKENANEHRAQLSIATGALRERMAKNATYLLSMYSIQTTMEGEPTICGLHLPNLDEQLWVRYLDQGIPFEPYAKYEKELIATALGAVGHVLIIIAKYLQIALRYEVIENGSRSLISDFNNPSQPYPLYSNGTKTEHFLKGLALLHSNLDQLMQQCGVAAAGLGTTLENLKSIFVSLRSPNDETLSTLLRHRDSFTMDRYI